MHRIAIFAHFDAQGEVKQFVLHHLECLKAVCQSVLFVSNSPVSAADQARLEQVCERVLLRENTGYDFSMWQHGLASLPSAGWDEVLLTNSSVFGPLFPLETAFKHMESKACDFWGMTDNTEFAPHIQSYFLVFRRRLLESTAFASFWQSVLPYRDKYQTIRSYEIGLTTFFTEQGFNGEVLASNTTHQTSWPRRKLYDLTLSRPLALLQAKMPYVKVGLLRDNPKGVSLKPIFHALDAAGYDRSMIQFDREHGTFHVESVETLEKADG